MFSVNLMERYTFCRRVTRFSNIQSRCQSFTFTCV